MTLEDRVAALEARAELAELEATYAVTWDTGQGERWADLFTAEGVFELVEVQGRPGLVVEGRPALAAFCHDVNRRWQGVHLMHPPTLSVDGPSASGVVYFQFRSLVSRPGFTQQGTLAGRYDIDYARGEDGRWRIRRRVERAVLSESSEFFEV